MASARASSSSALMVMSPPDRAVIRCARGARTVDAVTVAPRAGGRRTMRRRIRTVGDGDTEPAGRFEYPENIGIAGIDHERDADLVGPTVSHDPAQRLDRRVGDDREHGAERPRGPDRRPRHRRWRPAQSAAPPRG